MLADRGLRCVAGVCGNPWQKYTEAKTVQLRAPLLPNPQALIRNQGLKCAETFAATLLKTFSLEVRSTFLSCDVYGF